MTDPDNSRLYIDEELASSTGLDRRSILKLGVEGKIHLWYHFFDIVFSPTSPDKTEKRRLHSIELRISRRECSRLLEAVDLESFSVPDVYGYTIDHREGIVSNAQAKFPWMGNSPQRDLTIQLKNLFALKPDIDALEIAQITLSGPMDKEFVSLGGENVLNAPDNLMDAAGSVALGETEQKKACTATAAQPAYLEDKIYRGKKEIIPAFELHGRTVKWTQICNYRKDQGLAIVYEGRTPTLKRSELLRFLEQ